MGRRFFRVKPKGQEEETLPFGQIVQTQHGTNAWFMTIHTPMTSSLRCSICDRRSIKRGEYYMRSHTMRDENTGSYNYERVCVTCLPRVFSARFEKLDIFQMVDGKEQAIPVKE